MTQTLSDDITLKVSTSRLTPNTYANLVIYTKSVGVFSGRAWVDANNTPIPVTLNDLIIQNRGKDDYLELNENGEVETNPHLHLIEHALIIFSYFEDGQINNYNVTLQDSSNSTTYNSSTAVVLAGYDYENRNLVPNVFDYIYEPTMTTLTTRIMQGCEWVVLNNPSTGNYSNLLLPHYPPIKTKKYGLGMLIESIDSSIEYTLITPKTDPSNALNLGILYNSAACGQAFVNLYDLYNTLNLNTNEDTTIYLKRTNNNDDMYGEYIEGDLYYYADASIVGLIARYDRNVIESYDLSSPVFKNYLREYMLAARTGLDRRSRYYTVGSWNVNQIAAGQQIVYETRHFDSDASVTSEINSFQNFYEYLRVEDLVYQQDFTEVRPIFTSETYTGRNNGTYVGNCPIAIVDNCYERYYLAWNDRYGDIMSQPFKGKVVYSENITKQEVKNYKLIRRVSQKEIQPKWKLNTGWISEEIYPMYEAMFVSPYLLLYDTQTDRSWNVIISDTNYTEKTSKNDKMINLEINLEAVKKQNLIY